MDMVSSSFDADNVPLIEVLTDTSGQRTIGYRLGGYHAGPSVLVAGHAPVANQVYDRLLRLPTIGWMHGTLTLVLLNELEQHGFQAYLGHRIEPRPDEMHFLSYHLDTSFHEEAAEEGYWSTLRLCAKLGMISGRGVPSHATNETGAPDA